MWFSVSSWAGSTADLAKKLSTNHNTAYDEAVDELHAELSPLDIVGLRKLYDVAVLDRYGKDYIILDTKGKQFQQR